MFLHFPRNLYKRLKKKYGQEIGTAFQNKMRLVSTSYIKNAFKACNVIIAFIILTEFILLFYENTNIDNNLEW